MRAARKYDETLTRAGVSPDDIRRRGGGSPGPAGLSDDEIYNSEREGSYRAPTR